MYVPPAPLNNAVIPLQVEFNQFKKGESQVVQIASGSMTHAKEISKEPNGKYIDSSTEAHPTQNKRKREVTEVVENRDEKIIKLMKQEELLCKHANLISDTKGPESEWMKVNQEFLSVSRQKMKLQLKIKSEGIAQLKETLSLIENDKTKLQIENQNLISQIKTLQNDLMNSDKKFKSLEDQNSHFLAKINAFSNEVINLRKTTEALNEAKIDLSAKLKTTSETSIDYANQIKSLSERNMGLYNKVRSHEN
jgi:chromosome segregation ATPase